MTDAIDRAATLLNVIEKAVGHAPKFNYIAVLAEAELAEINEGAKKEFEKVKAEKEKSAAADAASRPKAIPSDTGMKLDESGKPIESSQTNIADRRI